jgi:hypothetical protein
MGAFAPIFYVCGIYNKGYRNMSNTTRLGDTDLINIAKQRFETQQRSKLPSIIVNLPSGGKIYPKSHPLSSGQVEMRYMTAYDEDILTNVSYLREGVIFDKLLESLILDNIDIHDIASVDRDALIINARIVSYGAEYPVQVTDPKTNKPLDRVVDLKKLQPKPFDLVADDNGEFSYTLSTGAEIKFAYLKTVNTTAITDLLKQLVTEVDGNRTKERIDDFIRYEFLARDSRTFREFVTNKAPGLNFEYEFEGEDGGTFTAGFPVGADLFWF